MSSISTSTATSNEHSEEESAGTAKEISPSPSLVEALTRKGRSEAESAAERIEEMEQKCREIRRLMEQEEEAEEEAERTRDPSEDIMAGIQPWNHWDADDCDTKRLSIENSLLTIRHKGPVGNLRLHAKLMVAPLSIQFFYFEIKVLELLGDWISVGLGSINSLFIASEGGRLNVKYRYDSDGCFVGHRVQNSDGSLEGRGPNSRDNMRCLEGQPNYGQGDIVGCGVDLARLEIIFTKNGQRLDTKDTFLQLKQLNFYPFVALWKPGDAVEANFGQRRFAYDLAREEEENYSRNNDEEGEEEEEKK